MAGVEDHIFPVFKTPPKSPGRSLTSSSRGSGSPGKSPLKRKTSLTIRQGHNQSNKIFRYLQPKRLLDETTNSSVLLLDAKDFSCSTSEEKENKTLELRVVLSRIDDDLDLFCAHKNLTKRCYCTEKKTLESELVVQALDHTIQAFFNNPSRRLGIPHPPCSNAAGCQHKTNSQVFSSTQENLFCTMLNSNLSGMMIRECLQRLSEAKFPSGSMVHKLLHVMKMSVDQQTLYSCERLLKRLLHFHPPCPSMRNFYLSVLHPPSIEIKTSDYWTIVALETFENVVQELEKSVEDGLSPAQLKEKLKTPTVRKILKPKRFRQSPSPVKRSRRGKSTDSPCESGMDLEDREKRTEEEIHDIREQARLKRLDLETQLKTMPLETKIDHIFSRFEILVDIVEHDLVVWLSRHPDSSSPIRDRIMCPLIVMALWRPQADTGFDTPSCRRIFSLYASSWILKVHPRHLKTLSRLIGLIAEVISASDPSYKKMYPHMGDRCSNLARKLSDVLQNSQLEENCHEAILMLRPVWLQMLVSSTMLGIPPSISSLDPATMFSKNEGKTSALLSVFLLSAVTTFHIKEADKLLQEASRNGSCEETPAHCQAPCHDINYKILLNEIVAFYQLRSKFDENSEVVQSLDCFHSYKEILS